MDGNTSVIRSYASKQTVSAIEPTTFPNDTYYFLSRPIRGLAAMNRQLGATIVSGLL